MADAHRALMPIRPIVLRRVWRAIGVGLILVVIWLSLMPHPIEIPVQKGDKLDHFAAYGTLMFWLAQLDALHRKRLAYAAGFVARRVSPWSSYSA
jgi:hypothetical protein